MADAPSFPRDIQLVCTWLAALDDVAAKLGTGADVADLGCGRGGITMGLARAYRRSFFAGWDPRRWAVEAARGRAATAGLAGCVRFDVGGPATFGGRDYDLVLMLGGLSGVPDPGAVARHVRHALARDGTWMVVERRVADPGPVPDPLRTVAAHAGLSRYRRVLASAAAVVLEIRP